MNIYFIIVSCVMLLFSNHGSCSATGQNTPPAHISDVLEASKRIHSFFDQEYRGVLSIKRTAILLKYDLNHTPYKQGASAYFSLADEEHERLQPLAIFAETLKEKAVHLFQWHRGDEGVEPLDQIKSSMQKALNRLRSPLSDIEYEYSHFDSSFQGMKEHVKGCSLLYARANVDYLQDTHQRLSGIVKRMPKDLETIQTYLNA